EVAPLASPCSDGLNHTADELAHAGFARRRAEASVKILTGHDVGGGHRPVLGDFHVLLLEDHVAVGVGDLGEAQLPFQSIVRRYSRLGEETAEGEPGGGL